MKKGIGAVVVLALLFCLSAVAETAGNASAEWQGYDWITLGTTAGATAAVLLIVQYTKAWVDKLKKLPTRAYVYGLSLLIMLGARCCGGTFAWGETPLIAINAVVVANAAMGAYEQTFAAKDAQDG